MYRISMVDDEDIVLNRLKQMFDKLEDSEIILESTFDNGDDAYNELSNNPPDILITDIHIPFINGLDLAKMLKKINPLMKIIVITGYEELSYAKEAIDLEVVGFLSKPIAFDELEKVINKAKEKISYELDIQSNKNEFDNFYNENIAIIKENHLNRLFDRTNLNEEIIKQFKQVNLNVNFSHLLLGFVDLDYLYNYEQILNFNIFFRTQLTDFKYEYNFFNKDSRMFLLIKSNEPFDVEEINDFLRPILVKAKRQLSISASVGFSLESVDNHNYRKIYLEATKAVTSRRIFGGNQVFLFSDINKDIDQGILLDDLNFKELTHLIKYENDNKKLFDQFDSLEKIVALPENLNLYYFNLTNILSSLLNALSDDIDITKYNKHYSTLYQELFEFKVIEEVFIWLKDLAIDIKKINLENIENKTNHNMSFIVDYIKNNYSDEDLSLDKLAEEVNFSVSYITKLFKTIQNDTFVKYLTTIRMNEAKLLLLNTNDKIIEISNFVGYKDPYYFSYSFKKQFGISPKEFRDGKL